MSHLIKWSVTTAIVLATANGALAANRHMVAAKANSFASAEMALAGTFVEPAYFIQAKGCIY